MRARRRHLTAALPWLGVAALAACNPWRRQPAERSDAPPVIIFENQTLTEAAVYAVPRGGAQVRIGTVQAGRTDTLTLGGLPLGAGSVTIVARLLAISRTPSTGPLTLNRGDRIAITLPSDARLLSVLPAVP